MFILTPSGVQLNNHRWSGWPVLVVLLDQTAVPGMQILMG